MVLGVTKNSSVVLNPAVGDKKICQGLSCEAKPQNACESDTFKPTSNALCGNSKALNKVVDSNHEKKEGFNCTAQPPVTMDELMALNRRNLELLKGSRNITSREGTYAQAFSNNASTDGQAPKPYQPSEPVIDPKYANVCNEVVRAMIIKDADGSQRTCAVVKVYKSPSICFVGDVLTSTECINVAKALALEFTEDIVPTWYEKVRRVGQLTLKGAIRKKREFFESTYLVWQTESRPAYCTFPCVAKGCAKRLITRIRPFLGFERDWENRFEARMIAEYVQAGAEYPTRQRKNNEDKMMHNCAEDFWDLPATYLCILFITGFGRKLDFYDLGFCAVTRPGGLLFVEHSAQCNAMIDWADTKGDEDTLIVFVKFFLRKSNTQTNAKCDVSNIAVANAQSN